MPIFLYIWKTETTQIILINDQHTRVAKKNPMKLDWTWNYIIIRDVNSDFSIVTIHRVAIIYLKLGVIKNFAKFIISRHFIIITFIKIVFYCNSFIYQ